MPHYLCLLVANNVIQDIVLFTKKPRGVAMSKISVIGPTAASQKQMRRDREQGGRMR